MDLKKTGKLLGGGLKKPGPMWNFAVLLLSVGAVFGVGLWMLGGPDEDIAAVLKIFDLAACAVFLADFLWRWLSSEDKMEFWRWGWVDLLSSAPFAYWARYFRIVSVWRALKNSKLVESFKDFFARAGLGSVLVLSTAMFLLSVWVCGILILHFERGAENALIKTPFDGIWFAFETVTTVGYGDMYPVTFKGKVAAIFLMMVGIGLFTMNSGLWASWILRRLGIGAGIPENIRGQPKESAPADEPGSKGKGQG